MWCTNLSQAVYKITSGLTLGSIQCVRVGGPPSDQEVPVPEYGDSVGMVGKPEVGELGTMSRLVTGNVGGLSLGRITPGAPVRRL